MREWTGWALGSLGTLSRRACGGWVRFDGARATLLIEDGENAGSLTDNGGTGDWTVTWTQPCETANYAVMGICRDTTVSLGTTAGGITTTSTRLKTFKAGGTNPDSPIVTIALFGARG